jgi:hypothetical protein
MNLHQQLTNKIMLSDGGELFDLLIGAAELR